MKSRISNIDRKKADNGFRGLVTMGENISTVYLVTEPFSQPKKGVCIHVEGHDRYALVGQVYNLEGDLYEYNQEIVLSN